MYGFDIGKKVKSAFGMSDSTTGQTTGRDHSADDAARKQVGDLIGSDLGSMATRKKKKKPVAGATNYTSAFDDLNV